MWYIIAEIISGTIGWWGPYEKEKDADRIAKQVNGVAMKIKDWALFSQIMDKVFDPLQPTERVM